MARAMSASTRANAELRLLQTLCTSADRPGLQTALLQLKNYAWSVPDYQVVFDALRIASSRGAVASRATLSALTTRAGFPDVDWDLYFGAPSDGISSIERALQTLLSQSD
jgi:hypothetical protein